MRFGGRGVGGWDRNRPEMVRPGLGQPELPQSELPPELGFSPPNSRALSSPSLSPCASSDDVCFPSSPDTRTWVGGGEGLLVGQWRRDGTAPRTATCSSRRHGRRLARTWLAATHENAPVDRAAPETEAFSACDGLSAFASSFAFRLPRVCVPGPRVRPLCRLWPPPAASMLRALITSSNSRWAFQAQRRPLRSPIYPDLSISVQRPHRGFRPAKPGRGGRLRFFVNRGVSRERPNARDPGRKRSLGERAPHRRAPRPCPLLRIAVATIETLRFVCLNEWHAAPSRRHPDLTWLGF